MKNAYAEKQRAINEAMFEAGMDAGFQKCWDFVQASLRCPDVAGKPFGRKKIRRLYGRLYWCEENFGDAWTLKPEADVKQEQLDAILREIWTEDEFSPFPKRYPAYKKQRYTARGSRQ